MGWNPYYRFNCNISEELIRQTSEAIIASGMKAAGYRYVNLDDCWMAETRGPGAELMPHPTKFPSGIRSLADYVHSRGLKFGLYAATGTATCALYPGSHGYFDRDSATFASWRVDYLKLDWCNPVPGDDPRSVFTAMRAALRRTGRRIVFSISE